MTENSSACAPSKCATCPARSSCAGPAQTDPGILFINSYIFLIALENIKLRMSQVKHKILILSGKGGVGKSTCSSQIATTLATKNFRVGVLDVYDLNFQL
jgi:Mrp family chromosome partitioning ATPase